MKLSFIQKIIALVFVYLLSYVIFYFFRDLLTVLPIVAGVAFMFFYLSLYENQTVHVGKAFASFLIGSFSWFIIGMLIYGLDFSRFIA